MKRSLRLAVALNAAALLLVGTAGSAAAAPRATSAPAAAPDHRTPTAPILVWAPCGEGGTTTECATAAVPLDYDRPNGETIDLALARVPAADPGARIGSLFLNFGGPGGDIVEYLRRAGGSGFAALNQRFDLVGMDPRGVGDSEPSIDCGVNQETTGIYSDPFPTPLTVDRTALLLKVAQYRTACLTANGRILQHLSTANVARDIDLLRQSVGDDQLSYLGFSYGTFLGATYATLFPDNFRALVLDGPLDANGYINRPLDNLDEQTAGFETSLGRFFQACAVDQVACSGFGGTDPWAAFDALVLRANVSPLQADGVVDHPEPVTGDDILNATIGELYTKLAWGELAQALAQAADGDGSLIRTILDRSLGRQADGSYDPGLDRYFLIGASEQRFSGSVRNTLTRGEVAWATFPHFWFNAGYVALNYLRWPARDRDAYHGPFVVPAGAPTPLLVATLYDPATPYRGAQRLALDLGNARTLTVVGDTHTAYGYGEPCIDDAVESYLFEATLPAAGSTCTLNLPFVAPGTAESRIAVAQTDAVAAVLDRLRIVR